ncbi:uncharacterized protein LOC141527081 [Cotesia typhae]|uniref:uncharacterized protein LOC141527081 n=1 Tax=Cotesia typhae TaxID=2053667 RepID=UPI003D6976E5
MFGVVNHLLKRGAKINAVQTSGFYAGYTILHHACEEGKQKIINTLLFRYNADPNIIALNGAQPIHVAVLLGRLTTVKLLLRAGADVDAKLAHSLCAKYLSHFRWEESYGIEQTLLTYAVINRNAELVALLINYNANVDICNHMKKTLLMYIVENNLKEVGVALIPSLKNKEINRRDKNGLTAIHYLIGLEKNIRRRKLIDDDIAFFVELLFHAGSNLNARVNGDPKTMLFNFAVVKCWWNTVYFLVYHYSYQPPPAGLLLYTIQGGDIYKKKLKMLFHGNCKAQNLLYSLHSRPVFNFPVYPESVELMKSLVEKHPEIEDFVLNECEKKLQSSICRFKQTVISFGDKKISIYDIIKKSDKELLILIRNKEFLRAFNNPVIDTLFYSDESFQLLKVHVKKLEKRIYLLRQYDKITFTEKDAWCHLPYDCICNIIDYLDNYILMTFIYTYSLRRYVTFPNFGCN